MKHFLGIAALALAMIAVLVPQHALYVSLAALALGGLAGLAGEKPFSAATSAVAVINLFIINPGLLDAINKSKDVLTLWVVMVVFLVLPFVGMALNSSGTFDFSERKGHH
jgi:hypothetical protein